MATKIDCWECGEKGKNEDPLEECKVAVNPHWVHKSEMKQHVANGDCKKEKKKAERKPNAAFMQKYKPNKFLAAVVGPESRPTSQFTKDVWTYFKANNCQDPENKQFIIADKKLTPCFENIEKGCRRIKMTQVSKLLSSNTTKEEASA